MKKSFRKIAILAAITFLAVVTIIIFLKNPTIISNSKVEYRRDSVSNFIKIVSQSHRSVFDYSNHDSVLNFLANKLQKEGVETKIVNYDSTFIFKDKALYPKNIFGHIKPLNSDIKTNVLLIAHYDSRYKFNYNNRVEHSFGAADNGYGMALIFELLNSSKKYRQEWKRGLKILFTDAEEIGLVGMKLAYSVNKDFFKDIDFVINLEARGVKGPAVLFETSGNQKDIIKLFIENSNTTGYSYTSFVYNILPNDTDFSVVKNEITGVNFAVIDNLNFYHTSNDNFTNINHSSIKHYYLQIKPALKDLLLTNNDFKKLSTSSNQNLNKMVYYSIPFFGILAINETQQIYLFLIVLILFFFKIGLLIKDKTLDYNFLFRLILIYSAVSFGFFAVGLIISYIISLISGVKLILTYLPFIEFDYVIYFILILSLILTVRAVVKSCEKHKNFSLHLNLVASESLLFFLAIISYIFADDSFMLLSFLIISISFSLLDSLINLRYSYLIPYLFTILIFIPFIYLVALAITIGSLSIILFLSSFIVFQLISLSKLYFCTFVPLKHEKNGRYFQRYKTL